MASTINGITFEEYCGGMSAEDAKFEADYCEFDGCAGCSASSPGGEVKCLMCRHLRIPENHPWFAEAKAFRESA